MSQIPPPVTEAEFVAVDITDQDEIKRRFGTFVRSLHSYLNQLSCLNDVPKARRRWRARVVNTDAFGNLATDSRHWYTFHHGGRNEAQFNVGLYRTHLRVGLGFEFSLRRGGDPTAVHLAYACFTHLIRGDRNGFERFVTDNDLEVEWADNDGSSIQFVPPTSAVAWLLNPPREPAWIFVGRLLRRGKDSAVLQDSNQLAALIQTVFSGFRPIWEQTQVTAHTM